MAKYPKEQRPPPTPKARKPWDQPPLRTDAGDKNVQMTYAAVGFALSHWEKFEVQFSNLFANLVGDSASIPPAVRAYGAIQTFRGRADMVAAASEAFFAIFPDEGLAKRVRDLLVAARGWSPRRNDVAHGVVWEPVWSDGKKAAALFPADYSTSHNKIATNPLDPGSRAQQRPTYAYISTDIKAFAAAFEELESEAEAISFELGWHRATALVEMRDRHKREKPKS